MMTPSHRTLLPLGPASWSLGVALLAACGPTVGSQRDESIPIPKAATYAWGGGWHDPVHVAGERDLPAENRPLASHIKKAIESQMAAKGYRLVDSAAAEFLIHYHVGVQRRTETVTAAEPVAPTVACGGAYACWGGGYIWGYWGAPEEWSTTTILYREGELMVDLVQRASGKLVWRAFYHETDYRTPVTVEAVDKAVAKTLKSLPKVSAD